MVGILAYLKKALASAAGVTETPPFLIPAFFLRRSSLHCYPHGGKTAACKNSDVYLVTQLVVLLGSPLKGTPFSYGL
jgi:hypothetical protein